MNNFTTKEQSLNLVKLGLNRDTADMCYYYNFVTETNSEIPAVVVGTLHDTTSNNIPCWSVGALLMLMPNGSFIKKSDFGSYFCQGVIYNTPIEAVYAYMVNLLQSNQ